MVLSMERWIGKVAIVTGASAGIGAGLVERLVEEGLVVVGFARRLERMEEMVTKFEGKKGSFHPVKCDVGVEEEILQAFAYVKEKIGPVHILINNAGVARTANLVDGDTEKWKEVVNLNFLGLCICTQEAIKSMNEYNIAGHIIHISSVFAIRRHRNIPLNVYPAIKAGIGVLAETLRFEFNKLKSNIKITNLSPGIVMTEIFDTCGVSYDVFKECVGGHLPYILPEDIADGVVYLLSTPPNVVVTDFTIRPIQEAI